MPDQIPATELLDHADQLLAAEQDRKRLAALLNATREALRLPADGDPNAIPVEAAAAFDAATNLAEQLATAQAHHAKLHTRINALENDLRSANRAVQEFAAQAERNRRTIAALTAAAPAADHAHRQLHAIREARAHHCGTYQVSSIETVCRDVLTGTLIDAAAAVGLVGLVASYHLPLLDLTADEVDALIETALRPWASPPDALRSALDKLTTTEEPA